MPTWESEAQVADHGTTASTITCPAPDGIQTGDLLVAQWVSRSTSQTAPPGWTQVGVRDSDDFCAHGVYTRTATGLEPDEYTFDQESSVGRMVLGIGRISGASGVDVAEDMSGFDQPPDPDVTAPTVDATAGVLVVRLWAGLRGSGTYRANPPSGTTERWNQSASSTARPAATCATHTAGPGATGESVAALTGSTNADDRKNGWTVAIAGDTSDPDPASGLGTMSGGGRLDGHGVAPAVTGAAGAGTITGTGTLTGQGTAPDVAAVSGVGTVTGTGTLAAVGAAPTVGTAAAAGAISGGGTLTGAGVGSAPPTVLLSTSVTVLPDLTVHTVVDMALTTAIPDLGVDTPVPGLTVTTPVGD